MRCEMPILINGVVKGYIGIIDVVLLDSDEVRVPVIGHSVLVERRNVVVVGRIRVGISAVMGVVALSPHETVGRPIPERPDLVLGVILGVGAVYPLVGLIDPAIPCIHPIHLPNALRAAS